MADRHRAPRLLRRRIVRLWREVRWLVVAAGWILAIGLGYVGFAKHYAAAGETRSAADIFYNVVQLFTLESGAVRGHVPWELEVARLLAPISAAYMALQALALIFRERFERLKSRLLRGHVVICGLGRKGWLLTHSLKERGEPVVVIERDPGNELIDACRDLAAIVRVGDARDPELLRRVSLLRARAIISVCQDDGVNTEVAVHARDLIRRRRGHKLACLVHIVDPRLCTLLRLEEMSKPTRDQFRLDFFNVFESGARALLREHPPFPAAPATRQPHVVLVGLGRFGEFVLLQTAREWRERGRNGRLRITALDADASIKLEDLHRRYPGLAESCELTARDIGTQAEDPGWREALFDPVERPRLSRVYVCFDDDESSISTALKIHQALRDNRVPIVVRLDREAGLGTVLREQGDRGEFDNLHAFGLLDRTCQPELVLAGANETIARAIHERYVRRQLTRHITREMNPSLVPWDRLPEDLKESNREQAADVGRKLAAIGCGLAPLTDLDADRMQFAPDEIERMARMEHERFVAERTGSGWTQTAGPKDLEEKTNPTLRPWDELTEEVKEIDRNMVRDIPELLAHAGLQVVRQQAGAKRARLESVR